MGWARVALMSRCGSGAAAATTTKPQPELPPHHKRSEPFRAIMHPLLWHAQPAHAARTASTLPLSSFARPVPQFRFRRQPFASTAKKQQQQHQRKKTRISFIYSKVSPQPAVAPPSPALLFLYMYIYFCRVEEEKIFFCETHTATGELDALLGSARETEKELRQRQERGSIWGWGGSWEGERWDCV